LVQEDGEKTKKLMFSQGRFIPIGRNVNYIKKTRVPILFIREKPDLE